MGDYTWGFETASTVSGHTAARVSENDSSKKLVYKMDVAVDASRTGNLSVSASAANGVGIAVANALYNNGASVAQNIKADSETENVWYKLGKIETGNADYDTIKDAIKDAIKASLGKDQISTKTAACYLNVYHAYVLNGEACLDRITYGSSDISLSFGNDWLSQTKLDRI